MARLCVLLCRIDDEKQPDELTLLSRQELPVPDAQPLAPATTLDQMESRAVTAGQELIRQLIVQQWQAFDQQVAAEVRRLSPQWTPSGDGSDPLKVATSVGMLWLPRQVLWDPARKQHLLPGNAWLPEHGGMLITRRLQEWACLLGSDFSFPVAQRLLGWQAGAQRLLCPKEVQRLVVRHRQVLRAAAAAEVEELLARPDLEELAAQWVPATPPRRPAAWPPELAEAVATALAAESPTPPEGVSLADWERLAAVRRAEAETPIAALTRLGPELVRD